MKKVGLAQLVVGALALCAVLVCAGCGSSKGASIRVELGNDMTTAYEWALADTGGALVETSHEDSEIDPETTAYTTTVVLEGVEGHAGELTFTFENASQSDDPDDINGTVTATVTLNKDGSFASLDGTDFDTDFPCSVSLLDESGEVIAEGASLG